MSNYFDKVNKIIIWHLHFDRITRSNRNTNKVVYFSGNLLTKLKNGKTFKVTVCFYFAWLLLFAVLRPKYYLLSNSFSNSGSST